MNVWTTIALGITLGGGGTSTPTVPGIEITAIPNRFHFSPEENRHQLTPVSNRLHLTVESDSR